MSTDTQVQPQHASDGSSDNGMGGSPPEVNESENREGGEGSDQDVLGGDDSQETALGDDSDAASESGGADSQSDTQMAALQQQLAERDALLNDIAVQMERDPELARRLNGNSNPGQSSSMMSGDLMEHIETTLRNNVKPEAAEAVIAALKPMAQRLASLEKQYNGTRRMTDRLTQSLGTVEYVRGLSQSGISKEVAEGKAFRAFSEGLRANPKYAHIIRGDQESAAEFVASRWIASRARSGSWKADQDRLGAARGGRPANSGTGSQNGHANGNNRGASRAGSLASQVFKIVREPGGGHVDKAHQIRVKFQKEGKTLPDIEYVDKSE